MAIQIKRTSTTPTNEQLGSLLTGQPLVNLETGDLYVGGCDKKIGQSLVEAEANTRESVDSDLQSQIGTKVTGKSINSRLDSVEDQIQAEVDSREEFDNSHNNLENGTGSGSVQQTNYTSDGLHQDFKLYAAAWAVADNIDKDTSVENVERRMETPYDELLGMLGLTNEAVFNMIDTVLTSQGFDINKQNEVGVTASAALGVGNTVNSPASLAVGYTNTVGEKGNPTRAIGSIAAGSNTKALGSGSIATGSSSEYDMSGYEDGDPSLVNAQGFRSRLVSLYNKLDEDNKLKKLLPSTEVVTKFPEWGHAIGNYSVNLGKGNVTSGSSSLTTGQSNINNSNTSVVYGSQNIIESGYHNNVGGLLNTLLAVDLSNDAKVSANNVVCGVLNRVYSQNSLTIGSENEVGIDGYTSNKTSNGGSLTVGYNLKNTDGAKTVLGIFNEPKQNRLLEIGNGTSETNRKNVFEVLTDGRVKVYGAPTAENDVLRWQDINLENGQGSGSVQQKVFPASFMNPVASGLGAVALSGRRYDKSSQTDFSSNPVTSAIGNQSFAGGGSCQSFGDWAFTFGKNCNAYKSADVAFGGSTQAGRSEEDFNNYYWDSVNNVALHGGKGKDANGNILDHEGSSYDKVKYGFSFAVNEGAKATGRAASAFGFYTEAIGIHSLAAGANTKANATGSVAIGSQTNASGMFSLAAGFKTVTSADYAAAFGRENNASNMGSFVSGYALKTGRDYQAVFGRINRPNTSALFIVGNGNSDSDRRNAFEVLTDNRAKVLGTPKEDNDVLRWQEKVALENADAQLQAGIITERSTRETAINNVKDEIDTFIESIFTETTDVAYSTTSDGLVFNRPGIFRVQADYTYNSESGTDVLIFAVGSTYSLDNGNYTYEIKVIKNGSKVIAATSSKHTVSDYVQYIYFYQSGGNMTTVDNWKYEKLNLDTLDVL